MKFYFLIFLLIPIYGHGFSQTTLLSSEFDLNINTWLEVQDYTKIKRIREKSKHEIRLFDLTKTDQIKLTVINRGIFFNKTADIYTYSFENKLLIKYYHNNVLNNSNFSQLINYSYGFDSSNNVKTINVIRRDDTLRYAEIDYFPDESKRLIKVYYRDTLDNFYQHYDIVSFYNDSGKIVDEKSINKLTKDKNCYRIEYNDSELISTQIYGDQECNFSDKNHRLQIDYITDEHGNWIKKEVLGWIKSLNDKVKRKYVY